MGMFDKIRDAIFGRDSAKPKSPSTTAASTQAQSNPAPGATRAAGAITATGAKPAAAPQAAPVDIETVLAGLEAENPQKLNWRTSIVDLMKLVDLDPSLENRKSLAAELGYKGDTGDSAAMNVWLHKQVMVKLQEGGGRVPASLRD